METLAAQPTTEVYDIEKRLQNDAETWFAEVLPGSMRTPFEYYDDGQELRAEDGSSLREVFEDAIVEARQLITDQPELLFELRRRQIEREELADMHDMARGVLPNTMVVLSDFPPELMNATQDVGGYNVGRKQTMLRVITFDGQKLKMFSQSLDQSDRTSLEAIYRQCGFQPEPGELLGQRMLFNGDEVTQVPKFHVIC